MAQVLYDPIDLKSANRIAARMASDGLRPPAPATEGSCALVAVSPGLTVHSANLAWPGVVGAPSAVASMALRPAPGAEK